MGGRTQEIQRLIGRSLRSVVQLEALGERTVWMDCDVIQADGGTRTASITGAFVALALALEKLVQVRRAPDACPFATTSRRPASASSTASRCSISAYEEDSRADVDMNVVQTGDGRFIEVQGTAETTPFDRAGLDALLALAEKGIRQLVAQQRAIVGSAIGG